MIDLHMHTIFSDGRIDDISSIIKNCKLMAITDHNTILSSDYYSHQLREVRYFIGCEVTVDSAPDYLVYFVSTKNYKEIEYALKKIRDAEEQVIQWCYYDLGYDSWESDKEKSFAPYQKIRNMQTKNLAAIIHFYKKKSKVLDCRFDIEDLRIARNERRKYRTEIGNTIPIDYAFQIARKFDGEIVLAHPIHTAIKYCSRNYINRAMIIENLDKLIETFASNCGTNIEWEYVSPELLNRYNLREDINSIRQHLWKKANSFSMKYTIGSDAHDIKNQVTARNWLYESEFFLKSRLARWIF